MAAYHGPNGEVNARQLDEDTTFQPSGHVGRKGEWLIRDVDGLNKLCDQAAFASQFRQKYPKPVDGERVDPPKAVPAPNATA